MTLIDVRSREEFNEESVPGAINWDFQAGEAMPNLDKDTEIILHCRSGGRADMAKQILIDAGFTNVTNIGGLDQAKQLDQKN